MGWSLDKNRPICPQITDRICVKIAKGEITNGQKLLSVREVALEAGVNPNTVQKAFETLENEGLIYSVRGSGWYAGDCQSLAKLKVQKLIKEKTEKYFSELEALGQSIESIKNYVKEWNNESDTQM